MRQYRFGVLAVAALLGSASLAMGQARVAPPGAVESTPLAPPPGAPTPVQNPPAAIPEPVPSPQPAQPAPALPGPVTPEPVQPAPAPQVPLEPQPVQPPPTLPAPGPQLPVPPVTPQQTQAPNASATLAGKAGDANEVDNIALVAKPVLMLAGKSSWDQGFQNLVEHFKILRAEAGKAGLPLAGRPLALFVETDDNGFRFEAMLPVGQAPEGSRVSEFGQGVKPGLSPAGGALRFTHVAPYDDIDSTYETITAYLEAKSITVKDAFLEEYVSEFTDPADPNLEINVYVQPK
jgi:effector-binding domain-containing protein